MNIIKKIYKKYNTLRSIPGRINNLENILNIMRERERERERESMIHYLTFLQILKIKTI